MSVQARCPACGGPVTFQVGTSLVTVCPYCRSVVARSDRGLEDLGKVADLVETASPLDVGIKGRFDGVPFALTGRTQFRHPAGGVWDEWYASFTDGRWGWLAEAQGRFYLTFEQPAPAELPTYQNLQLGESISVGDGPPMTVAEKNTGQTSSAVGEIPYRVIPGEKVAFADLSGPSGEFGTLDYSGDAPAVYLGRQVTLDELGIPPGSRRKYPGQEPVIQALHLNCLRCGGALELRAPDRSERVGCPACGALLDVKEGKLKLLQSLQPTPVQPIIPLGATGEREGVKWTCLGFMQRYVTFEGTDYFWEEYLLYQPRLGFRWLTRSDDHWNWVESLPPASVAVDGSAARHGDRSYQLFQKATARVAFVAGEFYWKVTAGEAVQSKDFVNAPDMLSEEVTKGEDGGEVNWSRGVYIQPDEVERMFGLKAALPRPGTIGPNQPFPYSGVYPVAAVLVGLLFLLGCLFYVMSPHRQVFRQTLSLNALPKGQTSQRILIPDPVTLRPNRNIKVQLTPRGGTAWVHIDGNFTLVQPPPEPGSPTARRPAVRQDFAFAATGTSPSWVYMSSVPGGEYHLQMDLTWNTPETPTSAELQVQQGVAHPWFFVVTLLMLVAVPIAVGLYQIWFESQRWQDSSV